MNAYKNWLDAKCWRVSPEQRADHAHFLRDIGAILPLMERFVARHAGPFHIPVAKFDAKERAVLEEALRILRCAELPISLIKVIDPDKE